MKKFLWSAVLLLSVSIIAGCSRNTTSVPVQDEIVLTWESIVIDENTTSKTGAVDNVEATWVSTWDSNLTWDDMIINTWVFIKRQNEFCKDPSLWWNCDLDDVYFQEQWTDGAAIEFPIGCYSGAIDRIVYRVNEGWTTLNTVSIQFNTEYTISRNRKTIWEQRNMDAPDHRPWVCFISFNSFQILSKWAN